MLVGSERCTPSCTFLHVFLQENVPLVRFLNILFHNSEFLGLALLACFACGAGSRHLLFLTGTCWRTCTGSAHVTSSSHNEMLISSNLEPDSLLLFCETEFKQNWETSIPSLLSVWFHWGDYLSAKQSGVDAGWVAMECSSSGGLVGASAASSVWRAQRFCGLNFTLVQNNFSKNLTTKYV